MQIDAISTLVQQTMLRDSIRRSQALLATAQREFSTGRHADLGLAAGEAIGRDLTWRAQLGELQSLSDGNKLSGNRLDLVQSTLGQIRDVANNFLQTLTGSRNAENGQATAKQVASAAMRSLISMLNTSYNGQALFGGINSSAQPVLEYEVSPASAAQAMAESEFFASFGMTPDDPGVVGIARADMEAFLDTQYPVLFDVAQWQSSWSQAADHNVTTRIDTALVIESGTNANIEPFRQLAQAFSMVLSLGTGKLNAQTFEAIADRAISLAGQGIAGIGFEQARLGIAEAEITAATERIALRMTTITGGLGVLEDVDKYEAAMRVNSLQSQLEASYTLTGRLSRLTLLNYI